MFPLWQVAIAPVLTASKAKKVVEIGALKGENTIQMLEHMGPGSVLHVIDPVPDFDPSEHETQFPGQYVFHQDLSLEVLPHLEPMDAAMIDGDHNWWTVYNECRLLAKNANDAGQPMPVMLLHDVLWPYGRRDLYYDPSNVPEERRQPYAYQGMRPGRSKLLNRGGVNATLANALEEGGDRNGVMTGVDDFIAGHPRPIREVLLPFYFGLLILVEEEHLANAPELAAALDQLESSEARYDMLEVAEEVRLRSVISQQRQIMLREEHADRGARRYLDVVKKALLNEHYLENEVRLAALADGDPPDPAALRDPLRHAQGVMNRLVEGRTGAGGPDVAQASSFLPYTAMGRARLDHLESCLDAVRSGRIAGDLVECGTGRGGGAIFLRAYLEGHEHDGPSVWVADRFKAWPDADSTPAMPKRGVAGFKADLNIVRDGFDRFDLLDDRVTFLTGGFKATLPEAPIESIALLRIGQAAGGQTVDALELLYDRVTDGGIVIVEIGGAPDVAEALDAFRAERGVVAPLERVDAAVVTWVKSDADGVGAAVTAASGGAPIVGPAATDALDLTVVVAFHDMRREAERTLQSLSRSYQEKVDDLRYEVLVIDNGSSPDQALDDAFVAQFGPEFRLISMGPGAAPSPVRALNQAIEQGRGRHFALMIDGAHVLTPGVLHYGMAAMRQHEPAIVATQQWYVGPGQQGEAMDDGYDQAFEDALFDRIKWPRQGYRLFEIGSFIGDRDWFDGMWESNCLFASRKQLRQVGAFDESFDQPGGAYANLDLFERLGSSPDVTVCSMLGEGSFHQIHGGTTTNLTDAAERRARVRGYADDYAELRGRAFQGPRKPLHFVGRLPNDASRRTRPRRLEARAFLDVVPGEGEPTDPQPISEDLVRDFTEAAWHTVPWRRTKWLGHEVVDPPTDLLAYQELIESVRPDVIIETGAGGGRTRFLASICDLIDHGRVIAVGATHVEHDRVVAVDGSPSDPATIARVHELADGGSALVLLGSRASRDETVAEFEAYQSLVPAGFSVVVVGTVVNGRPVWPAFGPGPGEAVKLILAGHADFVADPTMEKYSLSFNPGGFLKRMG